MNASPTTYNEKLNALRLKLEQAEQSPLVEDFCIDDLISEVDQLKKTKQKPTDS